MRLGSIFAVLLVALLVRGSVLFLLPGALENDPDGYRQLAENLLTHGTFGAGETPTAYRPPLYPILLAGCLVFGDYARVAIGLLHALLGGATVGLTFILGRRWGLSQLFAALAALLVLFDPILLYWSSQMMTETPAACLAVAGLLALNWASSSNRMSQAGGNGKLCILTTGIVLALGTLCRSAMFLWTAVAGLTLSLLNLPKRRFLSTAAFFAVGAGIAFLPWIIRNYLFFGRPIIATTHGGYTLLLGNNPAFYAWLRTGRWGEVWQAGELSTIWDQRHKENELQAEREAYLAAWKAIRREPDMFAYACAVRLGRFWSPLPRRVTASESQLQRLARYVVAVWYVLEYALAAAGVWYIHRRSPAALQEAPRQGRWLWGLLFVLSMMLVHVVYWSDMRMRAVVMPVVALAAAAAIDRKRHLFAHLCGAADGHSARLD